MEFVSTHRSNLKREIPSSHQSKTRQLNMDTLYMKSSAKDEDDIRQSVLFKSKKLSIDEKIKRKGCSFSPKE